MESLKEINEDSPRQPPTYNKETLLAIEEARAIAKGKIKSKSYNSADELFAELNAEEN